MSDILKFLFEESQLDADLAASVEEAEKSEVVKIKSKPLLKALQSLDIKSEGLSTDEEGCCLKVSDSETYHEILKKLGTVEAITTLASEGWVCAMEGDVADTTELPEYCISFIPISAPEMSDNEKPLTADELNKEYEKGSDAHPSPSEEERDGKSVKESADDLLPDSDAPNSDSSSLTTEAHASILHAASKIESRADVLTFFNALVEGGINLHPDTDFDYYVNRAGVRIFNEDDAAVLNKAMEATFNFCDPFTEGANVLAKALGIAEDKAAADDEEDNDDPAGNEDEEDVKES